MKKTGMQERTELLIGEEGVARLEASRVAVFGLGGVGGAAAEMLCRAGVGSLTLVDFDRVVESNLNRQLIALHSTVGRPKALVCAERLADINPVCRVTPLEAYFCEEDAEKFDLGSFDHVVDCIDTMKPKTYLIKACRESGVPIVVSAGAARKTDPTGVRVMDLFAVSGCALSRKLRKRLRPLGVTGPIPVATSPAQSVEQLASEEPEEEGQRKPIGSISYVPTVFGCVLAGWVVRSLLGDPLPLYTGKK